MQGLLANDEVIHWCLVPRAILNYIWLKADLLASSGFHKKDFNVTQLISDEGAVGSAPRLRDNQLCNGKVFSGSFFYKNKVPT